MPSQQSLRSAEVFLGNVSTELVRQERSAETVPRNEDGLRLLAADGNWNGVALLAEQLSAAARSDTICGVTAKLRYILVQVTAYFSMKKYAAAKKLVDTLGDLSSGRYVDPSTGESVVPFSLSFIAALLPGYCGATMDSQRRLYDLLSKCRQRAEMTKSSIWDARIKRVLRALIVSHYQTEQYSEALRLFEESIVAEKYNDKNEKKSNCAVVRQMLHLQQFATLCLHCGNIFLAEDIFRVIENIGTSNESEDVRQLHQFLVAVNQALWMSFNDRVEEAAHVFREVARGTREFCRGLNKVTETSSNVPTLSAQRTAGTADAQAQSALCRVAFHQMWVNAATSHITCMPYETTRGKNPTTVMSSIIETMEGYLRRDPVELLHSDAFLGNCVRLYTLEGDTRQKKVEMLADMLEVFRCDRDSAPPLGKMV
ncbi:uncharacterized protein TM35_000022160 [Trypanosoma theileri]|uniref:Uncharacterized protein n=1 Tax=Trypanosoma theileri TaxID=67003 RepID=A0A1X0P8W2_9TRYP|nr:uncharacterized protein TM35_000022160 [Trypanosoma theileri]ORC92890.1 hypothetical protein TM35_000022160 [Trypanosoma theileri]